MSYKRIIEVPDGIHAGIPAEVYHQRVHGLVSKHALDLFHRAPALYRAWLAGDLADENHDALALGQAFHCSLLEPAVFESSYVVEPDFGDCRYRDNKAKRDAWRTENASKKLVSHDDMTVITGMARAVRAHPLAGRMIADGEPELTLRWRDADTALDCKARPDYAVKRLRMGVDVKSAIDASPEGFRKAAARFGYHRQDAFYRDAFAAVEQPIEHFVFIVVEKTAPHLVGLYTLDEESIRKGYASVRDDMTRLRECLESDVYPGYSQSIQTLTLPPWAA